MIIKAMLELIKYLADKGNLLCIGYAVPGPWHIIYPRLFC